MLHGFFMKEDPILFYRLGKVSHDVDLTDSSLKTITSVCLMLLLFVAKRARLFVIDIVRSSIVRTFA